MHSVLFDATLDDAARRAQIYDGQLLVYSPTPGSLALVELARTMIAGAFGDLDPETAQYQMPVEDYAALLARLKPAFIHHPEAKRCIQNMLHELGFDLGQTYFDVPRMRTATSDDY